MLPRRPSLLIPALQLYLAHTSPLQKPLQICTFVFNHFQDAPPATPFLSTFCIVAGGWHGSVYLPFSLFHLPYQLSALECAVPQFPIVSLLECAVTKMGPRNSFRMRSYEKRWGDGTLRRLQAGEEKPHEQANVSKIDGCGGVCLRAGAAPPRRFAEDEDHTRARLCAAQSEPALQSSRHRGDHRDRCRNHRHWRRRFPRRAKAVRRTADRPGPAAYRTVVAGHVALVLLPARARKGTCPRRARSGALGHQGQSAEAARSRNPRRLGAQLLRMLQHRRNHPRNQTGNECQGARRGYDCRRLSRVSHGRGGHASKHHVQYASETESALRRVRAGA